MGPPNKKLKKLFIFDFHYFNESSEFCHPDELVHFAEPGKSSEFVYVSSVNDRIEGYYGHNIDNKP